MIKKIFAGLMLFSLMMAFSNADVSYARDRISFVPHKRDT